MPRMCFLHKVTIYIYIYIRKTLFSFAEDFFLSIANFLLQDLLLYDENIFLALEISCFR